MIVLTILAVTVVIRVIVEIVGIVVEHHYDQKTLAANKRTIEIQREHIELLQNRIAVQEEHSPC